MKGKVKGKSSSHVQLLATPWATAYQAPPSMGFSRQEYWSGVPLPSPGFYTTYKLTYHVSMDAGRRHDTPGSETKDFITFIDNSSPQQFPESQFLQQGKKRAITDRHSELHYKGGILS